MKKLVLFLVSLAGLVPCRATSWFSSEIPLQKCIGATTLLLGTLSKIDDIKNDEFVISNVQELKKLKDYLENQKRTQDLCQAIDKKNYKLALQFLDIKPNLRINDLFGKDKCTFLMRCCMKGDESHRVVQKILASAKLDITLKDKNGQNCLHYACTHGAPKITRFFLKRGDIGKILNAKTSSGWTPLDKVLYNLTTKVNKFNYMTCWNIMVCSGAVLNKQKENYKMLKINGLKKPNNDYVKVIRSNSPKDMLQNDTIFLQRISIENHQGEVRENKRKARVYRSLKNLPVPLELEPKK